MTFTVQPQPILLKIPCTELQLEISALDKKVGLVALASIIFFGLQFGLSLTITAMITFSLAVVTYFSEKYLRAEEGQKNNWLNFNFDKKELIFWTALLLLKPLIIQLFCWSLGIPLPVMAQEGLKQIILSKPWKMIPITCVFAPVSEEILFRGFLIERIEDAMHLCDQHILKISKKARKVISELAQGIIFGAIHLKQKIKEGMEIPIWAALSLFGFWMGMFKHKDQSLVSPIVLHSAGNTGAMVHLFTTP